MKIRTPDQIIFGVYRNMGDLWVRQPMPSETLNYLDPFILLHHGHVRIDPARDLNHEGVGPHPHRGFSPVTFVFKGGTHHRDSRGNNRIIREGGTQWMHAGMGIIHSERPADHEMEIIQLWINSPAKHKMDIPDYIPLDAANTPRYISTDSLAEFSIISGQLFGIQGPVKSLSPLNAAMFKLSQGAEIDIEIPGNHNLFLYLLDGKIRILDIEVSGTHMVTFHKDGEGISIAAEEATRGVLLSGEPIGEEIVSRGPFVMNSESEILQAMRDYQLGKMGYLVEEPLHQDDNSSTKI